MPAFYPLIVQENLAEASILPIGAEVTLPAMALFGGYEMLLPLLLGAVGAAIGGLSGWGIGRFFAWVRLSKKEYLSDDLYNTIGWYVRRLLWLALPFYWLPLGGVMPVAAGFFRLPWWAVGLAMGTGRLLAYGFKGY